MTDHHGQPIDPVAHSIGRLADSIDSLVTSVNINQMVLNRIVEAETKIMSAITDWAAQEQADLSTISTTLDGIVTGIKALDDAIVALQNSRDAITPADQAALDSIQALSKGLVAKAAGISTTPPVEAPPVVTPPTT